MTSKFERSYNGRAMRAVKRILDIGRSEPILPEPEILCAYDYSPGQAKWTSIWLLLIFVMCLMASCNHLAHATCQNPNTLSHQLKKAYYELKSSSKGDFKVSIRCNEGN